MGSDSIDKRLCRSSAHGIDDGEMLRHDCVHVLGIVVLDDPDGLRRAGVVSNHLCKTRISAAGILQFMELLVQPEHRPEVLFLRSHFVTTCDIFELVSEFSGTG